jgi:flagellar basal-body rod modification protein FlgD
MITPATLPVYAPAAGSTRGPSTELDRDAFMQLLVTQLRNQDPMSPLEPHEFAAQLAQFTSVEQLSQLNAEVAAQSAAIDTATLLGKTSLSAALIGRTVVAEGNQVEVPASGTASVRIDVGAGGGDARLRLLDEKGAEVASRELGNVGAGLQTLELPADLPAGRWRYEITVTDAKDAKVRVMHYTIGRVSGIAFEDGQILLHLGGIKIPLDLLTEIEPPVRP